MQDADTSATIAAIDGMAARQTTDCGAGQMVWRSWGSGPPLLLLHGDFGSWTHWIRNVVPLSRHFRVMVPDMPGYGGSALPPAAWTPDSLAHIVAAGIDALLPAAARYSIAGFSFGGIIAGHLAARVGARVDKLMLLGPGGLGLRSARLPPLRRLDPTMDAAAAAQVHRHNLAALMIADPARVDDLAVALQIENIRQARLRAGAIPESDILASVLPGVSARLYGIWGECDAFAQPDVRDRGALLRRLRPEVDFRTIGGAGHWTPYEAAATVNTALTEIMTA